MKNYRIEFDFKQLGTDIDYWGKDKDKPSFRDVFLKHKKTISELISLAHLHQIYYIWWFIEPHIEITLLEKDDQRARGFLYDAAWILHSRGFKDVRIRYPESGWFGDWFGRNAGEKYWGALRHSVCKDLLFYYMMYEKDVDNGFGIKKQIGRTIHTLCNPLGLNYIEEAKICFSRGLLCLLYRIFNKRPRRAMWVYHHIFRQEPAG